MGEIIITVQGSFKPTHQKRFTALHGGHAQAVAEAISFLSGDFLSDAIQLDHKLQGEGASPAVGFGKKQGH